MQKRYLGQTNIEITPLLVGTWQAGKKMWAGIEDEESIKAIRAAFEAGITTVDTAEIYGSALESMIKTIWWAYAEYYCVFYYWI